MKADPTKAIVFPVAVLAAISASGAWAQSAKPTDAQIAQIVVIANQVDIDAGKLAASKAQAPEVKAFAEQMVTDHSAVNKAAGELVQKLHVTPEASATSETLQEGGEKNVAKLQTLTGGALDKAYIDHEVAYHQAVLQAMDKTLIPDAQNAELKALLVKVRPAFVAHLDHARQTQGQLARLAKQGN